ncbi:MAG: hypothetical protein E4H13_04510 [Calditrichales bacterium]|nr:MAG: hypothetical protein E4H13_04510 [Calditrichales bacterium]
MSFKISYLTLAGILVLTVIAGCTNNSEKTANVVAQVNMAMVSNEQLEVAIPEGSPDEVKLNLKRNLMEKWIEDEIFYQSAEEEGLSLNEQEESMVTVYRKQLLIQKFLKNRLSANYKILDQEIEDYFDVHQDEFVWDEDYVHVIHLLLENNDNEIRNEIKDAKSLMDVIKKNFLDNGSTRERPIGDLGYQKLEEFPSAIVRSIRTLKTGRIAGPIKTEHGYHYVQLLDFQKKGARKDLEQARDEIVLRLQLNKREEDVNNLKQELRAKFRIQTDLSKLSEL